MCCFSGPVRAVEATKIFARRSAHGGLFATARQALVYEMKVATDAEVAMILPLPTPPRSPEDAVRFVSLELYDDFFADVERAFPPPAAVRSYSFGPDLAISGAAPPLVVHAVGAFVASFVPTSADMGRLDPRFRMAPGTLDAVPEYGDWGFAVFQLKTPGGALARVHPMALDFPTRRPGELFFPTLHVHDGKLHEEAHFAHTLYGQGIASSREWWSAGTPLSRVMKAERCEGLVDLDATVATKSIFGRHPNRDVWATLS
jgi:hypothetical protein